MVEYLWDGEMDCGWEGLGEKVEATSRKFVKDLLELMPFSYNEEAIKLISEESLSRFQNLAKKLAEEIQNGYYFQYEDMENVNDNAFKLNSWILLGSLTESALQIFLAFYMDDYKNSKWKQWENIVVDEVKTPIIDSIDGLIQQGVLTSKQGRTLKEAIKDKIKEHTKEHPVQRIMLDEIIQYYSSQELMDQDDIFYLKDIQSNRNGIHSFEERTIGTWNDLQYCVRFWCYLLEWIMNRLPDIPDYN